MVPLIWPALTGDKEAVGIDSRAASQMDGLADDYECWSGELPDALHNDKTAMYVPGLWDSRAA